MADYLDLRKLFTDEELPSRIEVATAKAATNFLVDAGATVPQLKWASAAISSLKLEGRKVLIAALAQNSSLTVAQIVGVSDAALQANVNAVIDGLVVAFANGV